MKKKQPQEIPVYLFTGFLEAGKTKFIQETLEDPRFNAGERTLLLLCEEGVEEYDPSRFSAGNVFVETVEDEADLTPERLGAMAKTHACARAVVEYNGMWLLDSLYNAMPEGWAIYQEMFLTDAGTFDTYNANMRQLTADKLKSCDLAVFNRVPVGADITGFHKAVRTLSTGAQIIYEHTDGQIQVDEIVDPLPFDIDAPVIEVEDRHYAIWFRDMNENAPNYHGKTVRVKGITALSDKMIDGTFVFGRYVMTCCAADIQFAGVVCLLGDRFKIKNGQWVTMTARVNVTYHEAYGEAGPVFTVLDVQPAERPEEEVATF